MQKRDLPGAARERKRGFQRGIVAAVHDHGMAGEALQRIRVVEQLRPLEACYVFERHAARHEGADAGGNEHGPGEKRLAAGSAGQQPAIRLPFQRENLFAGVEGRLERGDLLQQRFGQPAPGGDRRARDVVDRLVAVQRDALAAGSGQCVDDMAGDFEQAELEGLEQPDRARADDQRVCFDRKLGRAQRTSSEILSVLSFHSSASGRAGLRLVMLFQPSARASSALSLMKAIWLAGRSSSA